ncbi:MAG: hypothetical protein NUV98_03425, partial [Candidatus Roizmanbacteria bacterium]|nr:hypothetical protein [Candidatus Roizmanbacteria bacterium]
MRKSMLVLSFLAVVFLITACVVQEGSTGQVAGEVAATSMEYTDDTPITFPPTMAVISVILAIGAFGLAIWRRMVKGDYQPTDASTTRMLFGAGVILTVVFLFFSSIKVVPVTYV